MKKLSIVEAAPLNSEIDHVIPPGLLRLIESHRVDKLSEDPEKWGVRIVLRYGMELPPGAQADMLAGFPEEFDRFHFVTGWPDKAA